MPAAPNSIESLANDLIRLGIRAGQTVMVHSSLGRIGWTSGGPVAFIRAALQVLGQDGTLVMPAESPQISGPDDCDDTIRRQLPVFDPCTTPTTMGAIPEAFRTYPGTLRSHHPLVSVCANGRLAEEITREHSLAFCEGRGTPFEKLYTLGAQTLLVGVGFDRCTSLHYAESLVAGRRTTTHGFPSIVDGERSWVEVPDMANDNGVHFPVVGDQFVATHEIRTGKIGAADAMLFATPALVDFAQSYFARELKAGRS